MSKCKQKRCLSIWSKYVGYPLNLDTYCRKDCLDKKLNLKYVLSSCTINFFIYNNVTALRKSFTEMTSNKHVSTSF